MKNHAKVGNRPGRPAYRTPSGFRIRKNLKVVKVKVGNQKKSLNFRFDC